MTFGAPSSDGGAPISLYTVIASPGGATASGMASPITVAGLTDGVDYTFTVTASNSAGAGTPAGPSNDVTPEPSAPTTKVASVSGAELVVPAAAPDGSVWFTEPTAPFVARIAPGGDLTEIPLGTGAGSGSADIVTGPDGNMWVTLVNAAWAVAKIGPDGSVTTFDPVPTSSVQGGIALGADGNLWFSSGTSIERITPGGTVTTVEAGLDAASGPGVAAGADGDIWFFDPPGNGKPAAIGKLTPQGDVTFFTSGLLPGSDGGLLTAGPDGNVWFTDLGARAIGRVSPSGTITEFPVGLGAGTLPIALAVAPDGDIWFTEAGVVGYVGRITTNGTISQWLVPEPIVPIGIATGPDGDLWLAGRDGADGSAARLDLGAPAALVAPPGVGAGTAVAGTPVTCDPATWSGWAGSQPSATAFAFDGFQWLLDGSPIAGATDSAYTPAATDAGHALSCTETATYTLLSVTVSSTSGQVTVQASSGGGSGGGSTGGGGGSSGGGGGGAAPNLHVTVGVSTTPHAVGDSFDYLVTITNPGGASNGSTLTVNLPSQVAYEGSRVERGPGCTASGQTVTCNLDFFPPGLSTTVAIDAKVGALGTATLTTSTFSSPAEYDPSDSEASFTLSLAPFVPPAPVLAQPSPATASPLIALKLSGLRVVGLDSRRPSLRFALVATRRTAVTFKLLSGRTVVTDTRTAAKGRTVFELVLPRSLLHAGRHTLELFRAGAKPARYSFTLPA